MHADTPFQTIRAEALDPVLYDDGSHTLPRITRKAFIVAISRAFDLGEGREPGHGQRVAYIGLEVARDLGVRESELDDIFYAALLHDVGAAAMPIAIPAHRAAVMAAGATPVAELFAALPRDGWSDAIRALRIHCEEGARIARKLGCSETVARAVHGHHDCWDDAGPADLLSGAHASLTTRVIAAADRLESLIAQDPSPLTIRRRIASRLTDMAGAELAPDLAAHMVDVTARDDFWLGLYDNDLATGLMARDAGPVLDAESLFEVAAAVSDIVDLRGGREAGRGRRIADLAARVSIAVGLPARRAELVRLAALLQDIGTLGVPVELLHKPDILTIEEMAQVQQHPTYARDILSEVPGLGAAAWWVACHHERVDGKGYPGMLEGDEVPVESQVIGMAEAFDALTSDRPYRRAMLPGDALQVMRGLSGSRFAPTLLQRFEAVVTPY